MTAAERAVSHRAATAGAIVFAAAALAIGVHLAIGAPYRGFSFAHNVAIDILLGSAWTLAAIVMAARIKPLAFFPVVGTWLLVIHGFFAGLGRVWPGMPFLVAGLAMVFLGSKAAPSFRSPEERITG